MCLQRQMVPSVVGKEMFMQMSICVFCIVYCVHSLTQYAEPGVKNPRKDGKVAKTGQWGVREGGNALLRFPPPLFGQAVSN